MNKSILLILLLTLISCSSKLDINKSLLLINKYHENQISSAWSIKNLNIEAISNQYEKIVENKTVSCHDVNASLVFYNQKSCYQNIGIKMSSNTGFNYMFKLFSELTNNIYDKGVCWAEQEINEAIIKMKKANKKLLGKEICVESSDLLGINCSKHIIVDQEYILNLNALGEKELYEDVDKWPLIKSKTKFIKKKNKYTICKLNDWSIVDSEEILF